MHISSQNDRSQWVLLRGLIRGRCYWEGFSEQLCEEFPDKQVLTPELPGNGVRCREVSPLAVSDMVQCYRETLRENAGGVRVRLLGLSLGGMVATEWARQYPDEVEAVVLINSSARPFGWPWQRLRLSNWPAIVRLLGRGATDAAAEETILKMTSNLRRNDHLLLRRWQARQQDQAVSRGNLLRQLWAAARFRAPERAPSESILILAASQDRMVDVRCSRGMAKAWGCPLVEHPRAGHDLPLDDPEWVVAQIGTWLEQRVSS